VLGILTAILEGHIMPMTLHRTALAFAFVFSIGMTGAVAQTPAQTGGAKPSKVAPQDTPNPYLTCHAQASRMFNNPLDPRRKAFLKRCMK